MENLIKNRGETTTRSWPRCVGERSEGAGKRLTPRRYDITSSTRGDKVAERDILGRKNFFKLWVKVGIFPTRWGEY